MNMKKTQILFTVGLTSIVLSVIFILITINSPKKTETIIIKEQNTLEKSSQIVKDSLFALSKRVVQIENIINSCAFTYRYTECPRDNI